MILPLKRYADFTGRSRRMEFWMFQLFSLIVWAVLLAITFSAFPWSAMQDGTFGAQVEGGDPSNPFAIFALFGPLFWIGGLLMFLWWAGALVPNLAVTVRRLHDRGMSGWWYAGLLIAGFIPVVSILALPGYLVLFVILLLPGQDGMNKWGDNPKEPGQVDVFT